MYKLDKRAGAAFTHQENELRKTFPPSTSYGERLNQGWFLSATAYGIDPENPPKMEKHLFSMRKHSR